MKTIPLAVLALAAAIVMPSCVVPVGGPHHHRNPRSPASPGGPRITPGERYDHDRRYNDRDGRYHDHDRRYDGRGDSRYGRGRGGQPGHVDIVRLPNGAIRKVYHGGTYYHHGSTWYRPYGSGYIVTPRPY